jgi:hypothetical protein
MISIRHSRIELTAEPLEESLPPGMFAPDGSVGAQNAVRALRIIESIILDTTRESALAARHALLQSFPRLSGKDVAGGTAGFMRQYALALSPSWYGEFIAELKEEEVEILLKHSLHGHEQWGRPEGVGGLVRSMLENALHGPVPVEVKKLRGEEHPIPAQQHSFLGKKERYSVLGKDFLLGRRVLSRPERYEIAVGPVAPEEMDAFRKAGWAEGSKPSYRLLRLTEFAEPFYLHAQIQFLLKNTSSGFVLSRAVLGKGGLGRSA